MRSFGNNATQETQGGGARGKRQQEPLILAILTQAIVAPDFEIFVAHIYNRLQRNNLDDTSVKYVIM
jgi:hypothetical protein